MQWLIKLSQEYNEHRGVLMDIHERIDSSRINRCISGTCKIEMICERKNHRVKSSDIPPYHRFSLRKFSPQQRKRTIFGSRKIGRTLSMSMDVRDISIKYYGSAILLYIQLSCGGDKWSSFCMVNNISWSRFEGIFYGATSFYYFAI